MNAPAFEARNTAAPAISSGSPMRRSGAPDVEAFRISGLSHSARAKSVLIESRRDAVHAHVPRPEFDGQVTRQLEIGGFRNAIGSKHRGAAQAADRGDDDHATVAALCHFRHHQLAQPMIGADVGAHNLVECFVGHFQLRSEIRIDRGIADEHVDTAPFGANGQDKRLELFLVIDVAGHRQGNLGAARLVDRARDALARVRLAA